MTESDRARIIDSMPEDEGRELADLLMWQPNTAAALMTPAFVAVSPKLTADEAIAGIRQVSEEYESVHDVFVVDKEEAADRDVAPGCVGTISGHRARFSPDGCWSGECVGRRRSGVSGARNAGS
ncbi:MAG: hypothetical protein M9950_00930 [Thermomicrobiales bacterium]|nr:hypothetical protein [Thermomicrobiales bacterium]